MIRQGTAYAVILVLMAAMCEASVSALQSAHANTPVVFASVEMEWQDGKWLGRVFPAFSYDNGLYRNAAVYGEAAETGVPALIGRSILNRVKQFALYRKGRYVGTMRVTKLKAEPVCYSGSGRLHVSGVGELAWAYPGAYNPGADTGLLDAVSPAAVRPFPPSSQGLTDSERRRVVAIAKSQLRDASMNDEVLRSYLSTQGGSAQPSRRPVPHGDVLLEDIAVVTILRDRGRVAIASVQAPLLQPASYYIRMLLAVRFAAGRSPVVLMLPALDWSGNAYKTSVFYRFRTAMDITGDGVGQLVIEKTDYTGREILLFSLRGSPAPPVFEGIDGRLRGC